MQIPFGDVVVCDYELSTTATTPLELSLYSDGVRAVPAVLLAEDGALGTVRAPGVIDIPAVELNRHRDRFLALVRTAAGASGLRERLDQRVTKLDALADTVESWHGVEALDSRVLGEYHGVLVELMAFHVLNWWLPLEDYRELLNSVVGSETGRSCLFDLLKPSRPPHMLLFHREVLTAERSVSAAARLARRIGYLQTWSAAGSALESPIAMYDYLDAVQVSNSDLAALNTARENARRSRENALTRVLLAARGDAVLFDLAEAAATMCQLACDEEEDRRVHQLRAFRNFRRVAELTGVCWQGVTIEQLRKACDREPERSSA